LPEADRALLEAAARVGGETAQRLRAGPNPVHEKSGGHGPVSEADLAVDRQLRQLLTEARPGYGWLSEESEDDPARLAARRVFVVDPIDGTRGFLAGQQAWALSLAVVEDGAPIAAVVHLPDLGQTYAAVLGDGATVNRRPIAAAAGPAPERPRVLASSASLAPAVWPGGVPAVERHFRPSIAYRLCLVAEGRFDATFSFRDTWEWDAAAGDLIAREAGAIVTTRGGAVPRYNRPVPHLPGILAAAPNLHAGLVARL
jgi:myo-inositol-1(or 4)-monophosphatase